MSWKSSLARILIVIAAAVLIANPAPADPIAGAAIGAGVGAVAEHSISGRDGALVGGAVGAIAGYEIAKHHRHHRHHYVRYYYPRPVHYYSRPARVYYVPDAYYARPVYYRGHRHVHYHYDRYGRLVRVYTWR